jgi:hypothetical protein
MRKKTSGIVYPQGAKWRGRATIRKTAIFEELLGTDRSRFVSTVPVGYKPRALTAGEDAAVKAVVKNARVRLKAILGKDACSFSDICGQDNDAWVKNKLRAKSRPWSFHEALRLLDGIETYAEPFYMTYSDGDRHRPVYNSNVMDILLSIRGIRIELCIKQVLSDNYQAALPPDYAVPMFYYVEHAEMIAAGLARALVAAGVINGAGKPRFDRAFTALRALLVMNPDDSNEQTFRDKCKWAFFGRVRAWNPLVISRIERELDDLFWERRVNDIVERAVKQSIEVVAEGEPLAAFDVTPDPTTGGALDEVKTAESGSQVSRFYGDANAAWETFKAPARRVRIPMSAKRVQSEAPEPIPVQPAASKKPRKTKRP